MARGGKGGKRRTQYVRDSSGRFASTPGGGKKATPSAVRKAARTGSLAARTKLKQSKSKLAAIDAADTTIQSSLSKRAQKGAVTRAQKGAKAAIKSSVTRIGATSQSKIRKNVSTGLMGIAKSNKNKALKKDVKFKKDIRKRADNIDVRRVMAKGRLSKRKLAKSIMTQQKASDVVKKALALAKEKNITMKEAIKQQNPVVKTTQGRKTKRRKTNKS